MVFEIALALGATSALLWGLGHWLERRHSRAAWKRYVDEEIIAKASQLLLDANTWNIDLTPSRQKSFQAEELAAKLSAAFGEPFEIELGSFDPIDISFLGAERPTIAFDETHSFVGYADKLFEIWQIPNEEGLRISVSYTPSALHPKELEDGYRWTGKLAAELIEHRPVTITLNCITYQSLDPEKAKKACVRSRRSWHSKRSRRRNRLMATSCRLAYRQSDARRFSAWSCMPALYHGSEYCQSQDDSHGKRTATESMGEYVALCSSMGYHPRDAQYRDGPPLKG